MKILFFLSLAFQIASAQPLTLKDFNNELTSLLAANKLTPEKEFKKIRIRLGAEIGAATSVNHKEGELQRLMIYATLSQKNNKSTQNLKNLKSLWEQYLSLSNSSGRKFEPQYLWSIYKGSPYKWRETVENAEFLINNLPKVTTEFFFPLYFTRCEALEKLKLHDQLLICWEQLKTMASGRAETVIQVLSKKANYFYSNHKYWPELLKLENEIDLVKATFAANAEFQDLDVAFEEKKILVKLGSNQLDGVEKEIESLKAETRESEMVNRLLVRYFVAKSKVPEASKAFRLMNETLQTADKLPAYYDLGATVHVFKNELPVVAHYLGKYFENFENIYPEQIPIFLALIISKDLSNSPIDLPQLQAKLNLYEQIMQSQAIKDQAIEQSLIAIKEITKIHSGEQKEKAHLMSAIGALKGLFAPQGYMEFLIPKYLDYLERK